MKILYINHEKNLGGASKCLLGIIDEMKKKKHDILVLTSYKNGLFNDECIKREIKPLCVPIIPHTDKKNKRISRIIINVLSIYFNLITAMFVSYKLRKEKIDIIHTNTSIINIGCFLKIFMPSSTHIIHFREFVEEDFNWNFVPSKKNVMKRIKKRSDCQIFISNVLKQKYNNDFDKEKMRVIYDGVSLNVSNTGVSEKEQYSLAIVGRLIPGKGQDEAIRALDIIVHNYKFKDAKLYIIGSGDLKYKKSLQNLVKERNLENNVEFTGFRDDVNEFRKRVSYEIYCSSSEGFGRVIIESMLSKNITIAARAGAFPELIEHFVDGILYEKGNESELANYIVDCFKGNIEKDKLIRNAYKKAISSFSQAKNADNIEILYKEFLLRK